MPLKTVVEKYCPHCGKETARIEGQWVCVSPCYCHYNPGLGPQNPPRRLLRSGVIIQDLDSEVEAVRAWKERGTMERAEIDGIVSKMDALAAKCSKLTAEVAALREALFVHREDLHAYSSRPCPTCRQSAEALGLTGHVLDCCSWASFGVNERLLCDDPSLAVAQMLAAAVWTQEHHDLECDCSVCNAVRARKGKR